MISALKGTWALMLGVLLLQLGNGLQGTLLGVRGSLESIEPATMGYIMSGYFVGFLGGSKITPELIRRVGHVRVFAALGSLVSAVFILYALWVNAYYWFVLRVLVGLCFSGLYVVAESWLNDSADNETRGTLLSVYLIAQMIGIISGQMLLNIADPAGHVLFIVISVAVSVSFFPILLSVSPAPFFHAAKPLTIRELFHASPLGVVGTLLIGAIFSALFGMSAVYASEVGYSVAQVSYFIAAIYVGGLVLQYPIGWLSDRMDRRRLIILCSLIGALTALVPIMMPVNLLGLLMIAFFVGGMANPLYSLLIAHTNDFLEREQMAAASGSLLFVNGVGAMGGPIIVGYIMNQAGAQGFFMFILGIFGAIVLYGIYRMTRRQTNDETVPLMATLPSRGSAVFAELATEVVIDEMEHAEEEQLRDGSNGTDAERQ
ncbi:MAG: MFS transporter [Gammaproteobacteria bacterium]|nr:MFS transporter [Gammaproteobacteria bacterium]